MIAIKLVDARRGLNIKCRELFQDEKIAESIYRYLCDGIEECDDVEPERKVGEWIPVTERLPLYGQDVLAVRTYGDGEKCQEVLMAHIAVWNEETEEKWWNATNITHWMPLPEPPKEETHDNN